MCIIEELSDKGYKILKSSRCCKWLDGYDQYCRVFLVIKNNIQYIAKTFSILNEYNLVWDQVKHNYNFLREGGYQYT